MYVRLAFAVAAHLESEILIVDEVLAVGDMEFQKKALGKLKTVSSDLGKTVIFVSHNLSIIKSISQKGILLDKGSILMNNSIEAVLNRYEQINQSIFKSVWINLSTSDLSIYIAHIFILNKNYNSHNVFQSSQDIIIEINLVVNEKIENVKLGFDLLKNNEIVFRTHQVDSNKNFNFEVGNYKFHCTIPKNILNAGIYFVKPNLSVHCVRDLISSLDICVMFEVKIDTSVSEFHSVLNEQNNPGYIFPILNWRLA
jgi:lipopolysaccharide transport system ATP-binding protein